MAADDSRLLPVHLLLDSTVAASVCPPLLSLLLLSSSSSALSAAFSLAFPPLSLVEVLVHFSLPVSLGELKQLFPDEVITMSSVKFMHMLGVA